MFKAKIEEDEKLKIPRRFYDIEVKPSKAKPQKIAEAALKKIASNIQIKSDLSQLRFSEVKDSILGHHVLYQQFHDDKPISGAWIRVDVDKQGKVFNIQNDLVPETVLEKSKSAKAPDSQISNDKAVEIATIIATEKSKNPQIIESELTYYSFQDAPVLAWKVIVKVENPIGEWKIYLDSSSGELLEKFNLIKEAIGKGRIFDPNPVISLNDSTLKDDSQIPDSAYKEVTLKGLSGNGMLDGEFVSTRNTPNRVLKQDLQFFFKRPDRAFKEVMVYFHIDRVQRYIQSLGFNNVLNTPIPVHIDGEKADNSFYSPSAKSLTFGTGGVDDAEDADIILHEYGHAIQDNQLPGFGQSTEAGAMGEGFGDYLAGSFFYSFKPEKFKHTVGIGMRLFTTKTEIPPVCEGWTAPKNIRRI